MPLDTELLQTLFDIVDKYYIVSDVKELEFILISPITAATLGNKWLSHSFAHWFVGSTCVYADIQSIDDSLFEIKSQMKGLTETYSERFQPVHFKSSIKQER